MGTREIAFSLWREIVSTNEKKLYQLKERQTSIPLIIIQATGKTVISEM